MYIQWTVFCKNEKNHEMMEKISRIMDYEQATPEKGFYVSKRWKWPETSRIGRAYYASCLPENLEAQFAALDGMIGDVREFGDHLMLDAIFRADIMNVIAHFPQAGNKAEMRSHMTGRTAAGENNTFGHNAHPFAW